EHRPPRLDPHPDARRGARAATPARPSRRAVRRVGDRGRRRRVARRNPADRARAPRAGARGPEHRRAGYAAQRRRARRGRRRPAVPARRQPPSARRVCVACGGLARGPAGRGRQLRAALRRRRPLRAHARRGVPPPAPARLLLRRLVDLGAPRRLRRARRLSRDRDHGRLRLRAAPGAQRRHALPAGSRDHVGAALAPRRHRAHPRRLVSHPLAVRRGRRAAAARAPVPRGAV
ncbi:MAG: glycosyl transferase, family 2, partial [uncultured Solirubrobacteraceae bacterium]